MTSKKPKKYLSEIQNLITLWDTLESRMGSSNITNRVDNIGDDFYQPMDFRGNRQPLPDQFVLKEEVIEEFRNLRTQSIQTLHVMSTQFSGFEKHLQEVERDLYNDRFGSPDEARDVLLSAIRCQKSNLERVMDIINNRLYIKKEKSKREMKVDERHERTAVFVFGVVFVIGLLALAVFFPDPTDFQYTVFRIVLALASAGIAAFIPGFIDLTINSWLRAGGAIAVFVVVYFFSPANIVVQPPKSPVPTSESLEKIYNRPHLTINRPWKYGLEQTPPCPMVVKNIGKSPAININGSYGFQVVKSISDIKKLGKNDIAASLGEDDIIKLIVEWPKDPSKATWESIREGDSLLVVAGEITYETISNLRCNLEYCFVWDSWPWKSCEGRQQKNECR